MGKDIVHKAIEGGSWLATALSDLGEPTGVIGTKLQDYRARRIEEARSILIKEIIIGEKTLEEGAKVDAFLMALQRYGVAVAQGKARHNLVLLARAINGMLVADTIHTDEFNKYANALESLTRSEIILIGTLLDEVQKSYNKNTGVDTVPAHAWSVAREKLIPGVFETVEEMECTASAIMRTGLMVGRTTFGGDTYQTTSIALEVAELIKSFDVK